MYISNVSGNKLTGIGIHIGYVKMTYLKLKLTSEVATSNTPVVHLFYFDNSDVSFFKTSFWHYTNMDTNTVHNVWEASLLHYNNYKTIYYIITQLKLTIGQV